MFRLISQTSCRKCAPVKNLIDYAEEQGQAVVVEVVVGHTKDTLKAKKYGVGLPFLIDEDGAVFKDNKWYGRKREADKKTK